MKQRSYLHNKTRQVAQITACLLLPLAASTSFAADRVIKCQIDSNGNPSFKGKCLFSPEQGGSFTLSSTKGNRPLTGNITDISVYIVEKGVADVRGMTTDGNNSRWGEARRSSKEKACWVGDDFKVCAW